MKPAKAAVSWSGGKDSYLALERARQRFEVAALITMFNQDGSRSRAHGFPPDIVRAQAEALGLELITGRASWETYERQFKQLLRGLERRGFTHVVFGDILLEEHKEWTERVCRECGLEAVEPLWGECTDGLLQDFLDEGGQAVIVAAAAAGFDESWLGRPLVRSMLDEFKARGVDACGENGEFHTLVTFAPLFCRPLRVREAGRHLHDAYHFLDLALEP